MDGAGRILAIRRVPGDADAPWGFPEAEVGRGEDARDACQRAARDRVGADICDLRGFYTVEYDGADAHLSKECFLCRIDADGARGSEEGPDVRWIERAGLAELRWDPADREVARALAQADDAGIEALVKRRRDSRRSMRGNKRADTKPELLVRRHLREAGLTGYRLQWKKAPGRPDIAFPGRRVAIFVNGCFWHRCPHCSPAVPKRNTAFWEAKFRRNVERDRRAVDELERAGWTVITIWECQLKRDRIDETMAGVIETVRAAGRQRGR